MHIFELKSVALISVAICFVMFSTAIAHGQAKPDFLSLQRAVSRLMSSPIAQSEPKSVTEVRDSVNVFQKYLQESPTGSSDDVAAVQHLTGLLIAAAKEQDTLTAGQILKDVNRDLVLKNKFYGDRLGVAGQARSVVKVTVRTFRGTEAVSGFQVYCNPYRWADSATPMKTFGAFSTPTDANMLPGYYRCVAAIPSSGQAVGERLAEIGLDGKDEITLDIAVKK